MTGRVTTWDDVPLFNDLAGVAALIGKSRQTVWRYIQAGALECVDPDARPILVTKTHLQRWAGETLLPGENVVPLASAGFKHGEGTGQVESDANALNGLRSVQEGGAYDC